MLYGSTRSKVESYTAQRTVWAERASDGGFFVPMRLPQFKRTEIHRIQGRTAEDNIALILNKFFQTEFSGKDVEFAIGKDYFRLEDISQRLTMGELWHNPEGEIDGILRILTRRLAAEHRDGEPGEWPRVAIRAALLFGLFGELMKQGKVSALHPMDLAVPAGDFAWPMGAWYARKMGLPIATIILCCNENDGVRNLLHRGQIRLDEKPIPTITPRCDHMAPAGIERAIYTMLGRQEMAEYLRVLKNGGTYAVNLEQRRTLSEGMTVCVNNSRRLMQMIPNAYRTFGKLFCPYSAMVYTGAMDYQSLTGRYSKVLMLCDYSPSKSLDVTARAMGLSVSDLKRKFSLN